MEKNICFQFQILVLDLKKLTLNFKKKRLNLFQKQTEQIHICSQKFSGVKEKVHQVNRSRRHLVVETLTGDSSWKTYELRITLLFSFCVIRNKRRSSRLEVFCKTCILRNFAKFTGKHLRQSLFFNKVAGLRSATLFKKRLWHRCFPVNF